jgi:DNA repair protein RecN (Recombination protein N)
LKETGNFLVDLHGQHEHQSLLRVETHIDFLDEFHNNSESLQKYKNEFIALNELLSRLKELRNREELIKQKRDLYSFQIKEIDAVSPEEREDERISAELNILENSERILELTTAINNALYNSEGCAFDNLNRAKTDLSPLLKIDPSLKEVVDELETAIALVNDVNSNILRYQSKVELEPEKLDTLRIRLSAINMLKKKYGGSLQSLVEYRNKIGAEFELAENFETE